MVIDNDRVEYIISFLTSVATGGDYNSANKEFKEIRTELMRITDHQIKSRVPSCIKSNYDAVSFFRSMQSFGGYQDRRVQIRKEFMPLSDFVNGIDRVTPFSADDIKEKFNSEYITNQIELMLTMQKENPTEAIGKAKELVESCCKTILDELGETYKKTDDMGELMKKVRTKLKLTPESIKDDQPLAETLKSILGNFAGIVKGMAELRNSYGGGHGKSATYKGLEERHAKLAVSSAITVVRFLWDSYELKKGGGV